MEKSNSLLAKITIEMDGSIPPKKNSKQIFKAKNGRTIISSSKRYKEWHNNTMYQLMLQKSKIDIPLPIESCVSITTHLRYIDHRARDNTNAVESVHDILVDIGILKDDCWQVTGITSQIPCYDKEHPGATVVIELSAP